MFLDEAAVEFTSGRGGSGAVSFHREKHVPRGGPDGADGGKGGSIILIADRGRRTLYDFKFHPRFQADDGVHGVQNKRGRDAKDIEVKVPVGTVVTDTETGDLLVDMAVHGMKFVLCKGGKGGKGNMHYTSSVRQAPNFAQKGAPGERILAKLELKLLADVGLVGLPNAGKSTLISRISAARPKIADYPFTTIVPNLGVVKYRDETFVVADMPGLIQGASEGIGLGHQFLKHVDTFPIDESDPLENYHLIEAELKAYREDIWARPRLIALNKADILPRESFGPLRQKFEALGVPLVIVSAVTGEGMERLLDALCDLLASSAPEEDTLLIPVLKVTDEAFWDVEINEEGYRLIGKRLLRMVAMTDLENEEAVRYLQRRLERIGVLDRLRNLGIEEGDEVEIGEFSFNFTDES